MKYKINIAPLADYYVIAIKDENTDELKETFTLNESGADILGLFCKGNDPDTVAKKMAEMYDIPKDVVIKDILKLKEKLNNKGLTF